MSLWVIPAVIVIGAVLVTAYAAFLFRGLDDQGEPMEQQHDHD